MIHTYTSMTFCFWWLDTRRKDMTFSNVTCALRVLLEVQYIPRQKSCFLQSTISFKLSFEMNTFLYTFARDCRGGYFNDMYGVCC